MCQRGITFRKVPSLKLTASSPLKIGLNAPKGKNHLPTIHFQGLCHVSFREAKSLESNRQGLQIHPKLAVGYIYTHEKTHQKRKGNSHRFAGRKLGEKKRNTMANEPTPPGHVPPPHRNKGLIRPKCKGNQRQISHHHKAIFLGGVG